MSHTLNNWETPHVVPDLESNCCHIWRLELNKLEPSDGDSLSTQERQRSDKFLKDKDKQQYIYTRTVLRQFLAAYLQQAANEIDITVNHHGKPFLASKTPKPPLYFNISHARDLALLAFCRSAEVGVDIEYVARAVEYRKLAQRYFSETENIAITQTNETQLAQQFFRLWTRKEAFVKAVGTGLGFPLHKFSVSSNPNTQPILSAVDKSIYDGPCCLADIASPDNYMSTIVCLATQMNYKLYHWPLSKD